MARYREPYLVSKPGAGGATRWYWEPSPSLRKAGWRTARLCGDRVHHGNAPPLEVLEAARAINAQIRAEPQPGRRRKGPARGSLADVAQRYRASPRFLKLAEKTRRDYGHHLDALEAWAGQAPAAALDRGLVLDYYEQLHARAPAQANARLRVLRILLGFAYDKGLVAHNVALKPGLIGTPPRLRVWTGPELEVAIAAAEALGRPSVGDAVLMAATTSQRQGDLLALERQHYRDGRIRLKQSKRRAQVSVRVTPELRRRLVAADERRLKHGWKAKTLLVCEATGRAWTADHFRHRFAEVRALAAAGSEEYGLEACPSIASAWFMDLRDTAVTNLALSGATIPEICSITGHSEASAYDILKHYLALNEDMADSAIAKLIAWETRRATKND